MEKGEKDHGIYAYDRTRDVESYCGVKVITKEEQLELIQSACKKARKDQKTEEVHKVNYNRFEIDGVIRWGGKTALGRDKPQGYCKTYNSSHGVRHSVTPYTSYSCAECLAEYLIKLRSNSPGIKIMCSILGESSDATAVDISTSRTITAKLSKGICELTLDGITIQVSQFVLRAGSSSNREPVLELKECRLRNGTAYYGMAKASLLGIPVCASLLYGRTCLWEESTDFTVCSVPRYYPAWTELSDVSTLSEISDRNYKGKIWVHLHCRKCHIREPIAPKIDAVERPSLSREIRETRDPRDAMIQTLMAENHRLLEENRKLRYLLVEMTTRVSEDD